MATSDIEEALREKELELMQQKDSIIGLQTTNKNLLIRISELELERDALIRRLDLFDRITSSKPWASLRTVRDVVKGKQR